MYFPVSALLIEYMILSVVESRDSYGYEISQTVKKTRPQPMLFVNNGKRYGSSTLWTVQKNLSNVTASSLSI